jgi:hypothetical protein
VAVVTDRAAGPLLARAPWQGQVRPGAPFFDSLGLLVQDGFQGLAGEFPAPGQSHNLCLGQDVAVGGGLAGKLELAHQGQGLFDD